MKHRRNRPDALGWAIIAMFAIALVLLILGIFHS
jgi:hypothetical protein